MSEETKAGSELSAELSAELGATELRAAFEKVYLGGNKQTGRRNEHGDYVLPSIQDAWAGWDAAYRHFT